MSVARAIVPPSAEAAIGRAIAVLDATQSPSGSWKGDYSGPLFLPAMYVGTHHVVGAALPEAVREGMIRYLRRVQNADGGWGVGVENPSCVFGTVLCVVAQRLLGLQPEDEGLVRARAWLAAHGGPTASASWGKFFLAVLGLYDWEGVEPIAPETWLLPRALPVHPGRMWCHARMVYLPMAWLYGRRATGPLDATILALREELYPEGYDRVDWVGARARVAPTDAHTPRSPALAVVHRALDLAERLTPAALRARALEEILHQIDYEDRITGYRCIGPVNKLYDTLVWHFARPGGEELRRHLEVLPVYLWEDDAGVRMNGYDSSELWDTAFATQALHATASPAAKATLARAFAYVDATQVREDPPDRQRHYRCRSLGAWPFSTREHGWPITDCTAEGLIASLAVAGEVEAPLAAHRLVEAVDRLLEWQNPDGSWATYERTRAPAWLERLNPSDIFGDIMIDQGHTECTAASMAGLAAFRSAVPGVRGAEIDAALAAGRDWLLARQRDDGGWWGGWAVCFTYGTWFGVRGLRAAGVPASHPAIRRAVAFLGGLQRADGGWGEAVDACRLARPVPTPRGQPVQTAWAVLALLEAGEAESPVTRAGLQWLIAAQAPDGTWAQDTVTGVFNRTCSIVYHAYPKIFPLWALARGRAEGGIA